VKAFNCTHIDRAGVLCIIYGTKVRVIDPIIMVSERKEETKIVVKDTKPSAFRKICVSCGHPERMLDSPPSQEKIHEGMNSE